MGGARTYARGRGCLVGGYYVCAIFAPAPASERHLSAMGCLDRLRDFTIFFVRGRFGSRALLGSYYGIFHTTVASVCFCILESRPVNGVGGPLPISEYSIDIHSRKR